MENNRFGVNSIKGCFTALVTPFCNGEVDEASLRKLVAFQIKNGIHGLVPCGSTGEAATLSYDEHYRVIDIVVDEAEDKVPVIAGTGSNSTAEAILLTKYAERSGADAALLTAPYYNKPTQKGLYAHFKAISEETTLPIILYNVPGRTGINMLPETVAKLSELKNIAGIKEASGNISQMSDVIEYSRKDFIVLSGDDSLTLPLLALGGHGVISVTSNVLPRDMSNLCRRHFEGKATASKALHFKTQPLSRAMFVETNPVPVKTALSMMGFMREEFRLPLIKISDDNRKKLKSALKSYGVI